MKWAHFWSLAPEHMPTPSLICHFGNRKPLLAFALCSGQSVSRTLASLGLRIAIDLDTEPVGGMTDLDMLSRHQPLSNVKTPFYSFCLHLSILNTPSVVLPLTL